jgi:hypothetical protein
MHHGELFGNAEILMLAIVRAGSRKILAKGSVIFFFHGNVGQVRTSPRA